MLLVTWLLGKQVNAWVIFQRLIDIAIYIDAIDIPWDPRTIFSVCDLFNHVSLVAFLSFQRLL